MLGGTLDEFALERKAARAKRPQPLLPPRQGCPQPRTKPTRHQWREAADRQRAETGSCRSQPSTWRSLAQRARTAASSSRASRQPKSSIDDINCSSSSSFCSQVFSARSRLVRACTKAWRRRYSRASSREMPGVPTRRAWHRRRPRLGSAPRSSSTSTPVRAWRSRTAFEARFRRALRASRRRLRT